MSSESFLNTTVSTSSSSPSPRAGSPNSERSTRTTTSPEQTPVKASCGAHVSNENHMAAQHCQKNSSDRLHKSDVEVTVIQLS